MPCDYCQTGYAMRVLGTVFCWIGLNILPLIHSQAPYCYECSGLQCEPKPGFKTDCKSTNGTVAQCFFIGFKSDGIFRGCYEPNAPNVEKCTQNRLTNCLVCKGNGCNDQPIFQTGVFTCWKCSYGKCFSHLNPKLSETQCEKFVTGTVPSCFVRFSYVDKKYAMGCVNEMTRQDYDICLQDKLNTQCRFCETTNCNVNYFFDYFYEDFRLRCMFLPTRGPLSIVCDDQYRFPFYACFMTGDRKQAGCFNKVDGIMITNQFEVEDLILCQTTRCNVVADEKIINNICANHGRNYTSTACALPGTSCHSYKYEDENGVEVVGAGCATLMPCWKTEFCDACQSTRNEELCNKRDKPWFLPRCRKCEGKDCALVGQQSLEKSTSCASEDVKMCFTLVHEGTVARGCFQSGDPHYETCKSNPTSCLRCVGNLCNSVNMDWYCYQCSYLNKACPYDQTGARLEKCPSESSIKYVRCFTHVRSDGLVNRGCANKTYECPGDHKCFLCLGNGCNYETVKTSSCLSCHSTVDMPCANDLDFVVSTARPCPVKFGEPLCYTIIEQFKRITRGCTANLMYKEKLRRLCDKKMRCFYCDNRNCNQFLL